MIENYNRHREAKIDLMGMIRAGKLDIYFPEFHEIIPKERLLGIVKTKKQFEKLVKKAKKGDIIIWIDGGK